MEKLKAKYTSLCQALKTLNKALELFDKVQRQCSSGSTQQIADTIECDDLYRGLRDSAIQRFEYCTDLFWKYLKLFLETGGKPSSSSAPVHIIRTCGVAGFISEKQSEQAIKMVKDRNLTSHTYWEELAEQIVEKIPDYYGLMTEIATSLVPDTLSHSI